VSARLTVRRLRIIVGVVLLGFVFALAIGSAGLLGGGRALGSSTTVTVIGGQVLVRHGANGQFVAAVDGEVLNPGDAIRTGNEARAVLTYFEGSNVTIEPNSDLSIDAAATQGNDTIVQMTQNAGRTWHVVTKLISGGSKYEVRTPASTASVRGTEFTVDTDGNRTTITTTGGTVIDFVPDPVNPGKTVEVPVTAGQQHQQDRGQPPAPTNPAPAPERKVTITLSDENSIVIDTLGRANGLDKNGRLLLQTPGATLSKVDGKLVITLPNIPDGRLQALTRKAGGEVDVTTTTEDKGKGITTAEAKITANDNNGTAAGLAGLAKAEIAIGNSGPANGNGNSGSTGGNSGQGNSGNQPTPAAPQGAGGGAGSTGAGGAGSGGGTGAGGGGAGGGAGGPTGGQGAGGGQGQGGGGAGGGQGGPGGGSGQGGFVPPSLPLSQPPFTVPPRPSAPPSIQPPAGPPSGGSGPGGPPSGGSSSGPSGGSGPSTGPGQGGSSQQPGPASQPPTGPASQPPAGPAAPPPAGPAAPPPAGPAAPPAGPASQPPAGPAAPSDRGGRPSPSG
jgi:hypothetical protein